MELNVNHCGTNYFLRFSLLVIERKMKKKYMILLLASLAFAFTACDDDTEPGGTAIEKMAGDWWITVNAIIDGKEVEDPFELGHMQMSTYNTCLLYTSPSPRDTR